MRVTSVFTLKQSPKVEAKMNWRNDCINHRFRNERAVIFRVTSIPSTGHSFRHRMAGSDTALTLRRAVHGTFGAAEERAGASPPGSAASRQRRVPEKAVDSHRVGRAGFISDMQHKRRIAGPEGRQAPPLEPGGRELPGYWAMNSWKRSFITSCNVRLGSSAEGWYQKKMS